MRIKNDERIADIDELADDAPRCDRLAAAGHCQDGQMTGDDMLRRQRYVDVIARNERSNVQLWRPRLAVVISSQESSDVVRPRIEHFSGRLHRVSQRRQLSRTGI